MKLTNIKYVVQYIKNKKSAAIVTLTKLQH